MNLMHPIIDATPKISVITKIEVLRFNGTPAAEKTLQDFIDECSVLYLNDVIVEKTIAICKSHKIKLPDAIIAATAAAHNLILITRNISDFNKIAGLKILNPWV